MSPVVELNLVKANSYESGSPEGWEFKVNGKEFAEGTEVRLFKNKLLIQVIELPSEKLIDEMDVFDFIEDGDLVTWAYYGASSPQPESLNILIQHKDGHSREIKVNID